MILRPLQLIHICRDYRFFLNRIQKVFLFFLKFLPLLAPFEAMLMEQEELQSVLVESVLEYVPTEGAFSWYYNNIN